MPNLANINGWPRDAETSEAVAETYEGGSHMGNDNTREIPLTRGKVAIVDAEDYDWLMSLGKWHCTCYGYAALGNHKAKDLPRRAFMHRLINQTPAGFHTDHVDGNKLNNTRRNLRTATNAQNGHNRGKQKNNTSGYKGVYWHHVDKKWIARVCVNGKTVIVGRSATAEGAAEYYNKAVLDLHGQFAYREAQAAILKALEGGE